MATFKPPLGETEVRKTGLAKIRDEYIRLASDCNKILDGKWVYCHACNDFHSVDNFYNDKRFLSGLYPECKKALLNQATDYDKKDNSHTDNREKTIKVFQKLDLPFIDNLYTSALNTIAAGVSERNRETAYQHMLVMVKTLHQYKDKTFADSEFSPDYEVVEEDVKIIQKKVKQGRKIFGDGYSNEDYMYLTNKYDDFCDRTTVEGISQETYVQQICLQLLDIDKDRKAGKDVSKKMDALDKFMNSANLQPKQNVNNAATDSLTFSQLIAKWEETKPIPEPDPELEDVSGIGKKIRVWFGGWLANALGLNVPQSQEYLDEVQKYTVNKPEVKIEEGESSTYKKIFGSSGE